MTAAEKKLLHDKAAVYDRLARFIPEALRYLRSEARCGSTPLTQHCARVLLEEHGLTRQGSEGVLP
jgi:hypothetical protein